MEEEGVPCLICGQLLPEEENDCGRGWRDIYQLNECLQNYFLLKHVLLLPPPKINSYIRENVKITVCRRCTAVYLDKCMTIFKQLVKCQQKLKEARKEVIDLIKISVVKDGAGGQEGKWREIRRFVKRFKYKWTPVDFLYGDTLAKEKLSQTFEDECTEEEPLLEDPLYISPPNSPPSPPPILDPAEESVNSDHPMEVVLETDPGPYVPNILKRMKRKPEICQTLVTKQARKEVPKVISRPVVSMVKKSSYSIIVTRESESPVNDPTAKPPSGVAKRKVEGPTPTYLCIVCGRTFSQPKDLREHNTSVHSKSKLPSNPAVGGKSVQMAGGNQLPPMDRLFPCMKCHKVEKNLNDFAKHMLLEHPPVPVTSPPSAANSEETTSEDEIQIISPRASSPPPKLSTPVAQNPLSLLNSKAPATGTGAPPKPKQDFAKHMLLEDPPAAASSKETTSDDEIQIISPRASPPPPKLSTRVTQNPLPLLKSQAPATEPSQKPKQVVKLIRVRARNPNRFRVTVPGTRFPCKECPKVERTWADFVKHMNKEHTFSEKPSSHEIRRKAIWEMISSTEYERKLQRAQKLVQKAKESVERKTPENPSLTCKLCGKVEGTWLNFAKHMLDEHAVIETKPSSSCQCEDCGKVLNSTGGLWSHRKRYHAKEGGSTCEWCGAQYAVRKEFLLHQTVAHNICSESDCFEVCETREELYKHQMEAHGGERYIWKCDECGKLLPTRDRFKTHKEVHASNVKRKDGTAGDWVCDNCGKDFMTKKYLRYHVWHTHEKGRRKRTLASVPNDNNQNSGDQL